MPSLLNFLRRTKAGSTTIVATGLAAAGQWALIAITGRLAGAEQLGMLSWALAFVTPWLLLSSLQLRTVIAGHAPDIVLFTSLVRLRLLCLAGTTAILLMASFYFAPPAWEPTVVCILVWGVGIWIGDLLQGWMQVRGRIATAAWCYALRAVGSAAMTAVVLWLYPSWGAVATAVITATVSIGVLVMIEIPVVRSLAPIHAPSPISRSVLGWFLFTAPLGFATGIGALATMLPRFALMHWEGAAALGAFTAMTVMVTAACQLFGAPAPLIIARLAGLLKAGEVAEVRRMLKFITALALGLGLTGYVSAWLCGAYVMRMIFGQALGDSCTALPDMALVAVIELMQFPLGYLLTAGHCYRQQIVPTVVGFLVTAALVCLWVPVHGMAGAAWALMGGGGARFALMLPTGLRLLQWAPLTR